MRYMAHILITGGAGFIGSHLADSLLERGDRVRALDNLDPQVHGASKRPDYLHPDVDLQVGDVRDPVAVAKALEGIDKVVHLAAAVGVGQSMYQIDKYVSVNDLGTATLLQALTERPVQRLLVASSMSVYGEGAYVGQDGSPSRPQRRPLTHLKAGDWEVRDEDGEPLHPVGTTEDKPVALSSVYAVSKYTQEQLCLSIGEAYNIPTIALRFFNVFGTRQALSNPYTGVLAIFASRLLNDRPPIVYEDGHQLRDFVSVQDIANACMLALDAAPEVTGIFNIGSGTAVSVVQVARRLADALGKPEIEPDVSLRFRAGDVRHCYADISRAQQRLGFRPRVSLEDGLPELVTWLATQQADDRFGQATRELAARGLTA
jgi:dTDP-L-rhamnose 4-epimerase